MDPQQFDSLVRSLGRARSRRSAIAALFAGLALPLLSEPSAGKTGRGKQHGKNRQRRHADGAQDRGNGNKQRGPQDRAGDKATHQVRRIRQNAPDRKAPSAKAAAVCFGGSPCNPAPGANLKGCDFGGSSAMKNRDLQRVNLEAANLRGANASGANLRKANLSKACLIDANLRGVQTDATTNWSGALYCRTTMPDGSTNDSGCTFGTSCCPACDAAHPCPKGQVCCSGKCVSGDCCTNAQCLDPAKPVCRGNRCAPCTTNQQCGNGRVCCGGQCKSGHCCQDSDCANRPDRPCQRQRCDLATNTCVYTPLADGASCDDGDACTQPDTCQAGACIPGPARDCSGESDICNDGVCRAADGACIKQPKRNGTSCNADNDNCTVGDSCQNGVCTPGAGLDCRGLEDQCNRGVCRDDGTCGKAPKNDDTFCLADGNLCNLPGACRNGSCVAGAAVVCTASDACHVAGVCDPATGRCSNPQAPDGTGCGANGSCRNGFCVEICLPVNAVCDPATDTCCDNEGEICSDTAACANAGEPGRCCRDEGAFCTAQCDCCNGVCADGVCCRPGQQCNSSSECCAGENCIDNVCTQVCGTNNAICGPGPGEACCAGFRCVNGECWPETCQAPDQACTSASQCCPDGVITCANGRCCHPVHETCGSTDECCGINICGPQSTCCLGTFFNPEILQARGCLGQEHVCCPGTRCQRSSNACCVEEGQPVPNWRDGFLDCCHFTTRDGVCICHGRGEACASPGGNPFLSSCCDGLLCINNVCEPPCSPFSYPTCGTNLPCCGNRTCQPDGSCT